MQMLLELCRFISACFALVSGWLAWFVFVACILTTTSFAIRYGLWNKPFPTLQSLMLATGWYFWWRYK